jgi:hypothetical protein
MFRWLIFQYAQRKGDGRYFHKYMLPRIYAYKFKNVAIDLFFCKTKKKEYTHYECNSKEIIETSIKKQPFIKLVRKYISLKNYDGFMFGGHSNGTHVGVLGSRLASAKQLAKALTLTKNGKKLKCVAFDSCLMGNQQMVETFESCSMTLMAMSSMMPSHSFMENKHFFVKNTGSYKKYLQIIADSYMDHRTVSRYKYPCSSLFFIPQAMRLYEYIEKLEEADKIKRKQKSIDFCESVKILDGKIHKKLKHLMKEAQTGKCVISIKKD